MAITSADALINALANNYSAIPLDKSSIANQTAGTYSSIWRATGLPAQGAIPGTTPAVPTNATTGAFVFTNQTLPAKSYLASAYLNCSNANSNLEFRDRLAHMGGLSLNINTTQTITGLDLATLGVSADRLGAANYSNVEWFLEVYTDGGATASNATINVTFGDGTSNNLAVTAVGGTLRASRMIPLTPLIQSADNGKFIQRINSVVLSAATGAVGNFGFTATRFLGAGIVDIANKGQIFDWAALGLPYVPVDSCVFMTMIGITTATGTVRGMAKIAHG